VVRVAHKARATVAVFFTGLLTFGFHAQVAGCAVGIAATLDDFAQILAAALIGTAIRVFRARSHALAVYTGAAVTFCVEHTRCILFDALAVDANFRRAAIRTRQAFRAAHSFTLEVTAFFARSTRRGAGA